MDSVAVLTGMGLSRVPSVPSAPPVPMGSEPEYGNVPGESEAKDNPDTTPSPAPVNSRRRSMFMDQVPDSPPKAPPANPVKRILGGYWRHKLWTLPLTLLAAAGALMALPAIRYPVLALAGVTRPYGVTVTDGKTNTP